MLVIGRKRDQEFGIQVGGVEVSVMVVGFYRWHPTGTPYVRLGITAPPEVTIVRRELLEERDDRNDELC